MTVAGRQQAYSVGNKTYGFGRSNPTSGPVDPIGYRERNLMQNAIQRALSMSRAAGAGWAAPRPAHPAPAPSQPFYQANANGPQNQLGGLSAAPALASQAAPPPSQNSSSLAPSPTGAMTPTPFYQTNANDPQNQLGGLSQAPYQAQPTQSVRPPGPSGYVDPAGPPGMQGGGMPFMTPGGGQMGGIHQPPPPQQSPEFHPTPGMGGPGTDQIHTMPVDAPQPVQHQFMPGYAQQQHDIESNIYGQQRQINENAPAAYQHLTDVYAGRGLAHSGRYADDFGAAHNEVAGQLSGLDQQKAQLLAQLNSQNLDYNQQQESNQAAQFQQSLQNQIGQAGSLGIDNTPGPEAPDYQGLLSQLLSQYGQTPSGVNDSPFFGSGDVVGSNPATAGGNAIAGFTPTPAPKVSPSKAATHPAARPTTKAAPTTRPTSKAAPQKTPVSHAKSFTPAKAPVRRPGPQVGAKAPRIPTSRGKR